MSTNHENFSKPSDQLVDNTSHLGHKAEDAQRSETSKDHDELTDRPRCNMLHAHQVAHKNQAHLNEFKNA